MKKMLVVAAVAAVAFLGTASTASASAFSQCPGVQFNPNGCQFLVTFNADGSITTQGATGSDNVPYDNIEDTLVGIQNNTSAPILSLTLGPAVGNSGLGPFGFDGDGACAAIACGNASDSTGYGGLVHNAAGGNVGNVTFTNIQSVNVFADKGTVVFGANGIPAGGSAWFSLEDSFTLNSFPTNRVPEPTSLVLLGTGVLAVARRLRKA